MIRLFHNEKWTEFKKNDYDPTLRYAITDYGRVISYTDKIENGRILKIGTVEGYKIFRYTMYKNENNKLIKGKRKHLFVHRLVAEHFLPKKSDDKIFVLHLDHSRDNNYVENLQWATKAEMLEHSKKSPLVIEARKNRSGNMKTKGPKLTATQVLFIKKKLLDPNRKTRLRIIAKQFGVSEMALYRIKTGENWGHIVVPT
ncbi:MAG: HNH endonuclease [Bacteroidales bacterium]|jgi:hypothetical protein